MGQNELKPSTYFGKENLILDLTFEFALEVIKFSSLLDRDKKYVIARQLLKSGTSIGANVMEAQDAESKADFIHKFKIAAKEANETFYWLMLCNHSPDYPMNDNLLDKIVSIRKVINKIIASAKTR